MGYTKVKEFRCPNCGSTEITTENGMCKCAYCDTLFEQDGKRNITQNYSNQDSSISPPPFDPKSHATTTKNVVDKPIQKQKQSNFVKVIGFITLIIIFIPLAKMGIEKLGIIDKTKMYDHKTIVPIISGDSLLLFTITENTAKQCYNTFFIDPFHLKVIKKDSLDKVDKGGNVSIKQFTDHKYYIIVNSDKIWRLDANTKQMEDITEIISNHKKNPLKGATSIQFASDEAIEINKGKDSRQYYYPVVDKVYTEDERHAASIGFKTVDKYARDSTIYVVSKENGEAKIIPVTYKSNNGAPSRLPILENILTLSPKSKAEYRILNIKTDKFKERYAKLQILYSDNKQILIVYKKIGDLKNSTYLAAINAVSEKEEWVVQTDALEAYFEYKDMDRKALYLKNIYIIPDINDSTAKNKYLYILYGGEFIRSVTLGSDLNTYSNEFDGAMSSD